MKTHDMKRVFKIATRLPRVNLEFYTETLDSWRKNGKLKGFTIYRPPYAIGVNYYRLANVKLVFEDNSVFWAEGLENFSKNFIGFVGTGNENQYIYLKFHPPSNH